jgi:hypothetical protein
MATTLGHWAFDEATQHPTADGRHTFYRVEGQPANMDTARAWGVFCGVRGEGATPEDALADAMRRAVAEMDAASQRRFEIAAVALRGGPRL